VARGTHLAGPLLAVALAACSADEPEGEVGIYLPGPPLTLNMAIRDFKHYNENDSATDPDFEFAYSHIDLDVVADTIGSDRKPVYKNPGGRTITTHGKEYFDKWYRNVAGTNIHVDYPIVFAAEQDKEHVFDSVETGVYVERDSGLSRKMFLPIDDGTMYETSFGNQGDLHNYVFTGELHAKFTFAGGETLECSADDDLWVFVADKLVINLGGLHNPEGRSVAIDDLSLERGKEYDLDLFYAERKGTGSLLLVKTTLDLRP
jgi:fibro-slime domain-containing protein